MRSLPPDRPSPPHDAGQLRSAGACGPRRSAPRRSSGAGPRSAALPPLYRGGPEPRGGSPPWSGRGRVASSSGSPRRPPGSAPGVGGISGFRSSPAQGCHPSVGGPWVELAQGGPSGDSGGMGSPASCRGAFSNSTCTPPGGVGCCRNSSSASSTWTHFPFPGGISPCRPRAPFPSPAPSLLLEACQASSPFRGGGPVGAGLRA